MRKFRYVFVVASALLAGISCGEMKAAPAEIKASSDDAIAETTTGKIAGYIQDGINIFKGIPYAKASRFTAPEPSDSWTEIRSCRAYGPTYPQGKRTGWNSDESAFAFSWDDGYPGEDCQRLNIWTQGLTDGGKRPVMVWLHGGAYVAGSGQELPSYDGANLAKEGLSIIVLTFWGSLISVNSVKNTQNQPMPECWTLLPHCAGSETTLTILEEILITLLFLAKAEVEEK